MSDEKVRKEEYKSPLEKAREIAEALDGENRKVNVDVFPITTRQEKPTNEEIELRIRDNLAYQLFSEYVSADLKCSEGRYLDVSSRNIYDVAEYVFAVADVFLMVRKEKKVIGARLDTSKASPAFEEDVEDQKLSIAPTVIDELERDLIDDILELIDDFSVGSFTEKTLCKFLNENTVFFEVLVEKLIRKMYEKNIVKIIDFADESRFTFALRDL